MASWHKSLSVQKIYAKSVAFSDRDSKTTEKYFQIVAGLFIRHLDVWQNVLALPNGLTLECTDYCLGIGIAIGIEKRLTLIDSDIDT
jgi:hypothetical protein